MTVETVNPEWMPELEKLLGRPPTVSQLRDGRWMADYMGHKVPFVDQDPTEALRKLYEHLKSKSKPSEQ